MQDLCEFNQAREYRGTGSHLFHGPKGVQPWANAHSIIIHNLIFEMKDKCLTSCFLAPFSV